MTASDTLIDGIIAREGSEYTNRPADHGGPTKYGVTLATLSKWRKHPCSAADVAALEQPEARQIYESIYITPFASLRDAKVKEQMIDFCVTSGQATAVRIMQLVLGLAQDAVLGPATTAAINAHSDLSNKYACARAKFYVSIAQHDISQLANLMGWVNRALSYVA